MMAIFLVFIFAHSHIHTCTYLLCHANYCVVATSLFMHMTVMFLIMPLGHIPEPSISSVEVTRLNRTTFNLSVSLAYTGGGVITHFRISFRKTGTTSWHPLGEYPATPSPDSSLVWNWVMSRNEFDTSIPLTFNVLAVNSYGLVSTEAQVNSPSGMLWSCSKNVVECVHYYLSIPFFSPPVPPPFNSGSTTHPSMSSPLQLATNIVYIATATQHCHH